MKLAAPLILSALLVASCSQSLEQIVEQNHQARIDAANANKPLTRGAADGMGSYIVETSPRMSVQSSGDQQAGADAKIKNP